MSVNEYNVRQLCRLQASVKEFMAGKSDLEQVQSALQLAIGLIENDGSGLAETIRLAEADVEEIRFTRLLDEQLPAVIFRLDELLAAVSDDRAD